MKIPVLYICGIEQKNWWEPITNHNLAFNAEYKINKFQTIVKISPGQSIETTVESGDHHQAYG